MSPVELLVVASAVLGWIGVLLKVLDLRRSPHDRGLRSMVAAIAGLAAAFTLEIPALYHGFGSLTGIRDLSRLVVHGLVLLAACAVQTMLIHWADELAIAARKARLRWFALTGTLIALTILFAFDPTRDQVVDVPDRFARPNTVLTLYSLVFYVFLTYSMAETWRDAWRYARQTQTFLRAGLRCLGVTGLVGTIFGIHQAAYLLIRAAGLSWDWPRTAIGNLLALIAVIFLLAGVALPTVGARLASGADRWRQRRALARLEPLWQDINEVFPELWFAPQADGDQRRAVHTRLYRRYIEIQDARLRLREFFDPTLAERARAESARKGLSGSRRDAVVEATQIACAIEAARELETAPAPSGQFPEPPERDEDFPRELAHLQRVADAYTRSPIVASLVTDYLRHLDHDNESARNT